MFRMALGLGLIAASFSMAGCRMCQHPYDYCGPVYDSGCGSCAMPARAGSVLDGAPADGVYEPMPAEPQEYQEYVKSKPARAKPQKHQEYVKSKPVRAKPQKHQRIVESTPVPAEPQDHQDYATQGGPRFGIVPGSERIISITERVVESAAPADESTQIAEESTPGSPGTLPAAGWTARRLDSDARR